MRNPPSLALSRFFLPSLIRQAMLVILFGFSLTLTAHAQQPFYTDDADVTEYKHFHIQFNNEFDVLQRFDYPSLTQNTSALEVGYGLAKNLEVSVNGPLIGISNSRIITPRRVV